MKKISIIVPVYNVEKYLAKCLDSLLKQTIIKEIKILIVDDGSTDNSGVIADEYAKNYPDEIVSYHKENGGIASVRNFALKIVDTEYFGFIDSDDYIDSKMYESLLNTIGTVNNMAVCNFYYTHESKDTIFKERQYHNSKKMMTNLHAVVWNKLFKTQWIKDININFIEGCRYEDVNFLYKIAPHLTSIEFIDDAYVHYVQRQGSYMSVHNEKVLDVLLVLDDIFKYYRIHNFYEMYQDELEYVCIKFCLGQPFRSASKIKDKNKRRHVQASLYNYLKSHFPKFQNNKYLKQESSIKHLYFRSVNNITYKIYAFLLSR